MQKIIHRAEDRGTGEHGWLHTRFSFSFADWYEPTRMGFGALRVINDDTIEANSGFGAHSHANMEIITIVTAGTISHRDSMGNSYQIPAGDVQVMSAGTGVTHSEYNNSPGEKLELFQIWIEPKEKNIKPRYEQKFLGPSAKKNEFEILVSGDKTDKTLWINQDASISRAVLDNGASAEYKIRQKGNGVYLFVIDGEIEAEGENLGKRDAIGMWDTDIVAITAKSPAQVLAIEVPMKANF